LTAGPRIRSIRAGDRLLFLDRTLPGDHHNVARRVVRAEKHPANPILPLGDLHEWDSLRAAPWEARTVLYDAEDRLFKAWYQGAHFKPTWARGTGYAVSEDGVTWHKPILGLFDYEGSTRNNICYPHFGSVVKDLSEPDPSRLYKMAVKPKPVGPPAHLATSPDGIHWTEGPTFTVPGWPDRPPDIAAFLLDEDDPDSDRRFKLVWQTFVPSDKSGPAEVRAKCLSYSPDALHWHTPSLDPVLTPVGSGEHENHFLMLARHAARLVMPYEYSWYVPDGTGVHGAYAGDVRLAIGAEDGSFYRLNPHEPLVARGRPGEWDESFLVISDKLCVKDDTMYFFYAGHGREWTSWPGSNVPPATDLPTAYARTDRMGLATLPLDRFTAVEVADRESAGWFDTAPFRADTPDLRLCANIGDAVPYRSWLQVEVLDAITNAPLPDYARDACAPIARDGIRVPIHWRAGASLPVSGGPVRLRCHLYGAVRLHALSAVTLPG
jgi:hypothetical protein